MEFTILNVDHGFAAYAIANDGSTFLFDCGHSQKCRPSEYIYTKGIRTIRGLFITNYDEDHITDLPNVLKCLRIETLFRNKSLTSMQIYGLKEPPISNAMALLLNMIDVYNMNISNHQIVPYGIRIRTFQNTYPTFKDTNNLSLLTFLDIGSVSFVIPGDLERAGWLALLNNPQVCHSLKHVNVFIASHHGRKNGYCKEIFDHCQPSLVVISDGSIMHNTQKMSGIYAKHATGNYFTQRNGKSEWRKVLTTRNDGHISWQL